MHGPVHSVRLAVGEFVTASRPFLRTAGADASARKPYDIISEPTGDNYRGLLVSALSQCDSGVLVAAPGDASERTEAFMAEMRPHIVSENAVPIGTIIRFTLNPASFGILAATVPGLYGWRQPELPGDLCLFRRDGAPWLVTVASERLGYVEVTPFEKLLLGRNAAGLPASLANQGARDAVLAMFERRLESALDDLTALLSDYAQALVDDGRDGLVDALGQWLDSDEPSRVAVALDVAAAVGLDELYDEVVKLRQSAQRAVGAPPVFRTSSVLSSRWTEMHRHRLERVMEALGSNVAS